VASGAMPWKATSAELCAAMMPATAVPWPVQSVLPCGSLPVMKLVPSLTCPRSCGWLPSTPESSTATVWPPPRLNCQARSGASICCGHGTGRYASPGCAHSSAAAGVAGRTRPSSPAAVPAASRPANRRMRCTPTPPFLPLPAAGPFLPLPAAGPVPAAPEQSPSPRRGKCSNRSPYAGGRCGGGEVVSSGAFPGERYAMQVIHPGSPTLRVRYRAGILVTPSGVPDWLLYARAVVELPPVRPDLTREETRVVDVLAANEAMVVAGDPLWEFTKGD